MMVSVRYIAAFYQNKGLFFVFSSLLSVYKDLLVGGECKGSLFFFGGVWGLCDV